ncbi:hypothetical protein GCM10011396_23090 [Undibacterium terreum]|uniref:TniQ domain-containing protein n=2 Tax=Undibacterium terreum TaxID=1224302 RepID=A0A916UJH8_9BURK|nr:hypothetical protein GCM10011396_23090 [Undibacterium terreum]
MLTKIDGLAQLTGCLEQGNTQISKNHTAFNYLGAFLRDPTWNDMRLKQGASKLHMSNRAFSLANEMGTRIQQFRYCMSCCEEQIQLFGHTYWARHHLMPGVEVCWRHQEILQKVQASIHTDVLPKDFKIETNSPEPVREQSIWLAKTSETLLATEAGSLAREAVIEVFQARMISLGFKAQNGFCRKKIRQKLIATWGTHALERISARFLVRQPIEDWLPSLYTNHNLSFPTLHHLLLIGALYKNFDTFFRNVQEQLNGQN